MAEWIETTLGKFVALQRGHDLPSSARVPGGVPVIGSGGPAGWHNKAKVKGPGITIGRAANLGVPTLVHSDFWPLNTTLYVTDFRGNDVRFVYNLFKVIDLAGFNSGSVQPMLNRNYIQKFPLVVPVPRGQRAIAAVLGALDDKIAVNERIAMTTRQLGITLFEAAVEIGKVTIPVEKLAVHLNRGQAPKYTDTEDGMIVLNQKCVRNGRVNVDPARRTEAARVHAERRLVTGDVLVNSTGVGTLGRVGIWSHDLSATVDSHIAIVRINPSIVPPVIGAFAMLSEQPTIEAMGEGSTGQTELSRAKLGRVEIALPSDNHEILAKKLTALETKSDGALQESRTLAALRDTLLPQLMSGKLRVRDVERIVEDAV